MILIAGLGNPGEEYYQTRHNIGFEIIDALQTKFEFPPYSKKFNSYYSQKNIFNKKDYYSKANELYEFKWRTNKKNH